MKTHLKIKPEHFCPRAVVCGDPQRAKLISSFLEDPIKVGENREYHSYLGRFNETPILISSHGVGAPGAAICFYELMEGGVKSIIRVGTAGGLSKETQIGDLVLASGAIRKNGVANELLPVEFPAFSDMELTLNLKNQLETHSIPYHVGIVASSDLFYPGVLDPQLELYQRCGAIAIEMECATLMVMGLSKKVKTASILALDGNPLEWKSGYYDPDDDRLAAAKDSAIRASLNVLSRS